MTGIPRPQQNSSAQTVHQERNPQLPKSDVYESLGRIFMGAVLCISTFPQVILTVDSALKNNFRDNVTGTPSLVVVSSFVTCITGGVLLAIGVTEIFQRALKR